MTMAYDESTDVVRIRTEGSQPTVAVPMEDLTVLVAKNSMDHVVGIDIQDLPSFASLYISDSLVPPTVAGAELFKLARPHLERLAIFYLTNLGHQAKEQIVAWESFAQRLIMQRERHAGG